MAIPLVLSMHKLTHVIKQRAANKHLVHSSDINNANT